MFIRKFEMSYTEHCIIFKFLASFNEILNNTTLFAIVWSQGKIQKLIKSKIQNALVIRKFISAAAVDLFLEGLNFFLLVDVFVPGRRSIWTKFRFAGFNPVCSSVHEFGCLRHFLASNFILDFKRFATLYGWKWADFSHFREFWAL